MKWQVVQTVLMRVLAGLPCSVVAACVIRSLLYGVAPFDPSILMAVVLAIAGLALSAVYLPARRASTIDSMVALRCEWVTSVFFDAEGKRALLAQLGEPNFDGT